MNYTTLRNLHLIFGLFSLPFLVMYTVSAVQMAHNKWFTMKPTVTERTVQLQPRLDSGREAARLLIANHGLQGDLRNVEKKNGKWQMRILTPGVVNEISYDPAAGNAKVKTSANGTLAFLNRLHHAAGLWPEYGPLKLWGIAIGVVSLALVGLAATGLWMWWMRKQERRTGLVLLAANLAYALVVLALLRMQGP